MNTAPANAISPNRRSSSLRCIFGTIPKMRYDIDDNIMPTSSKNVNQVMNSNNEFKNDSSIEADRGYVRHVSNNRMERKSLLSKLGKSLRDIKPFTSSASSSDDEMGYSYDGSHESGDSSYEPTHHNKSITTSPRRTCRKVSRRSTMDYSQQLSSSPKFTTDDTIFSNNNVETTPVPKPSCRKVSRRSTMDYCQQLSTSKVTSNDTYKSNNNNVENMSDSTYCSELEYSPNNNNISSNRPIHKSTKQLKQQQNDTTLLCPSPIRSPVKAFRRMSMQYSKRWLSKEDMTSTDLYTDTGSDPSVSTTLEGGDITTTITTINTEPPKTIFFKLLNQMNPSSNASSQTRQEKADRKVLFEKVESLMTENPRICKATYLFNAFIKKSMNNDDDDGDDINEIYPLHFLCSINAPITTIKLCHKLYEPAMQCLRSDIGNPLHYACYYGTSIDIIQYLIMKEPKNLARINIIDGRTPLLMTCLNRNTKYISDILSIVGMLSIHINKTDNYGNMPLHLLCSYKPTIELLDLIVSLMKKDACTFAVNKLGQTPLHLAVRCSNIDVTVIKTIIKIQTTTAAPYTTDKKGQTPLHVAIRYYGSHHNNNNSNNHHHHYDKNIISYLARKFPQTLTIQDMNGKTPADIAQQLNLGSKMIKILTPSP